MASTSSAALAPRPPKPSLLKQRKLSSNSSATVETTPPTAAQAPRAPLAPIHNKPAERALPHADAERHDNDDQDEIDDYDEGSTPTLDTFRFSDGGLAVPAEPSPSLDHDLDLDLHDDLAAQLLRRAASPAPVGAGPSSQRGRSPSASHSPLSQPGEEADEQDRSFESERTQHDHSFGRSSLHAQQGGATDSRSLNELDVDAEEEEEEEDARERDSTISDSWVGGLPREELEAMLVRANKVIRERERDLGLAAAIGKALLEKNMSLRSKHDGILQQLAAAQGGEVAEGEEEERGQSPTPPLMNDEEEDEYSPARSRDRTPRESIAPLNATMQDSLSITDAMDYFGSNGAAAASASSGLPTSGSSGSDLFAASASRGSSKDAGLIESRFASPSNSSVFRQHHQQREAGFERRHAHTSSTGGLPPSQSSFFNLQLESAARERQLHELSEQNDALVGRLAELQAEAEEQRKEGSRKLRTLDKELAGLREELDQVVVRNAQLEEEQQQLHLAADAQAGSDAAGSGKKGWKRRGPIPDHQRVWNDLAGRSTAAQNFAPSKVPEAELSLRRKIAAPSAPAQEEAEENELASTSVDSPARSTSLRSDLSAAQNAEAQAAERALVSQLLAKIQELEEANAAIARAGSVMDGKLGKAIAEGERIRDAYEAVETASVISGSMLDDEQQFVDEYDDEESGSASHDGGSPAIHRSKSGAMRPQPMRVLRRAPGNRHIIETQRTIQLAIARERARATSPSAGAHTGGSYMQRSNTDISVSSSTSSRSGKASSYGGRRASGISLNRPKIRITPSMEALRDENNKAEAAAAAAAEWQASQKLGGDSKMDTLHPKSARRSSSLEPAPQRNFLIVAQTADDPMEDYDPSPSPSPAGLNAGKNGGLMGMSPSMSLQDLSMDSSLGSIAGIDPALVARLEALKQDRKKTLASEIGSTYSVSASSSYDDDLSRFRVPSDHGHGEELSELMRAVEEFRQEAAEDDASYEKSRQSRALALAPPQMQLRRRERRRTQVRDDDDDDAHSDIANVRFGEEGRGGELVAWNGGPDTLLMRTLTPADDGNWRGDQDLLPAGAYQGQPSSAEGYDLLDRATSNQQVAWADDEDFGKPITMKQAEQYGLLQRAPGDRQRKRDMLPTVVKNALGIESAEQKRRSSKHSKSRTASGALQIESAEQLEEQENLTALLRKRRMQFERALAEKNGHTNSSAHVSEATAKALALTSSRRGRPLHEARSSLFNNRFTSSGQDQHDDDGYLDVPVRRGARSRQKIPTTPPPLTRRHSSQQTEQQLAAHGLQLVPTSQAGGEWLSPETYEEARSKRHRRRHSEEDDEQDEDGFELLHLDPSKRRAGRRGTDYWPVSTRARYAPGVLKRRVEVASAEAVVWMTTWMAFVSVLICACIFAFA